MPDGQAEDPIEVTTPAQYRALGHPARHRLLMALRQRPATLAQLAAATGTAKGTVAYHVTVLVRAGLLREAGERTVRGGTERYYEPTGSSIAHPGGGGAAFLLDAARAELLPPQPGDPDLTLLRHVALTPEQAGRLAERLAELVQETGEPTGDGTSFGVLVAVYRADVPLLPPR